MQRFLMILGLVPILVSVSGETAEKRAFEIADYYRTARVGDPVLSPDGGRVAFTVTRYELASAESWTEIWMMSPDGSGLRQMTARGHHDGSPAFSPDGKQLLFSSDRGGDTSQLYLMPVDGGEAHKLTDFPLSLSSPVWSPDGRWIAVTAEVYPECGADAECNGTIAESWADGPLQAHMTDELLFRHWDSWRDGRFSHILLVDAGSGEIVRDLTPGRWDSPTFGEDPGFAFSPDGKELCYVSNHDPIPAASTNADLWLVKLGEETGPGSAAQQITAGNEGWDGDPVYSPDGRRIAFRSQETPGYESDLIRLAVYDRRTGKVEYPIARQELDDWVDAIAWSPGGSVLYHQVRERARNPIYQLDLASGERTKVVTHGSIAGWQLSSDGATIVFASSAIGEPPELYRVGAIGGRSARRLTGFNAELAAEVDIRPAEEIWVDGDGDYQVQVFVVKPHDFDPGLAYPLILNVRGGPQGQWSDSYRGDWQVYPGKGYVVAFPNPTGSTGFGQDFVDAVACDWGGRAYQDLMKVTDALEELPYVDSKRMGAMGWSYGGYMMMWFAGHTDRFKALASMMGIFDLRSMYGGTEELWFVEHDLCGTPWRSEHYKRWSPANHVTSFKTPTLVITGERDYRVPYTESLQFFTALQRREVPSRLIVLPNAGHWPGWYEMAFYYLAHLDWFHRYLGGEPPPWEVERFLRNQVFTEDGQESGQDTGP